ncbi:MAG TPA: hypothetical protein VFS00_27620 [Polyangiaceae bacterium]|nr:hypothetical protein [Polyangiaceae bacterium]
MRLTLALAALALASLGPAPALADVALPGMTHVPLELTLDGQAAFSGAEIVVLHCNSADGRHIVGFAKPDAPLACKTKMPPIVYAVPKKEAAELRALVAKDLGWGSEFGEAEKLLEKAAKCGEIGESTYLEDKLGVAKVVGRYALDKGAAGACSLRKVSWTQVKGANAAPPTTTAAQATPTAPAKPAPTTNQASAPAEVKGCALAAAPAAGPPPWALLALALGALARRRAGRPSP